MEKKRYVCRRCAENSPTCCRLGGQDDSFSAADCFPLSKPERVRIEQAIAKARVIGPDAGSLLLLEHAAKAVDHPSGTANWSAEEPNSKNFIKAMRNLFPKEKKRMEEIFPSGGSHLRLSLTADGSCVFLSEYGCTLPRSARPLFCRIFPFWVVGGIVQCFSDDSCLAVREYGEQFLTLLGAFDQSLDDLTDKYATLRSEWGVD